MYFQFNQTEIYSRNIPITAMSARTMLVSDGGCDGTGQRKKKKNQHRFHALVFQNSDDKHFEKNPMYLSLQQVQKLLWMSL